MFYTDHDDHKICFLLSSSLLSISQSNEKSITLTCWCCCDDLTRPPLLDVAALFFLRALLACSRFSDAEALAAAADAGADSDEAVTMGCGR